MQSYRFLNSGRAATLYLYGGIGDDVRSAQVAADLERLDRRVSRIDVKINSGGGLVFEGYAIFNLLKRHPARVLVSIDGMALSIASVVAMAGDEIEVAANAVMMIHETRLTTIGGRASDHTASAELLGKLNESIVGSYVAKTGQAESRIRQWMQEETWFTATEAVEAGFADRVVGALQVAAAFDLSGYKRVPAAVKARVEACREGHDRNAVAEWNGALGQLVAGGLSPSDATRKLVRTKPALHKAMLIAANAGHAYALEQLQAW